MEEMKECPFCGSIDTRIDLWHTAGHTEFSVVCNDCSASGPYDLSERQAVAVWNMRRPMNKMLRLYAGAITSGN